MPKLLIAYYQYFTLKSPSEDIRMCFISGLDMLVFPIMGHILLVEDEPTQQRLLSNLLEKRLHHKVKTAKHGKEALEMLKIAEASDTAAQFKLVIMDVMMPVMDGMEALKLMRERFPSLPIIMLTGNEELSTAVEAMRHGAADFLTKPVTPERLEVSIQHALELKTLRQEVSRLARVTDGTVRFTDIVGYDQGLLSTVSLCQKAAKSDIPVLLSGQTGVGKELFAHAIHGESARSTHPFIAVNCGAIPENLIESTLFGHEKGSFTGATQSTKGKFREAAGGTIFLDEVGELPMEAQVKLLRVLQEKEVEPVGGSAVAVDVRVISATNRRLAQEVAEGRFREDLFFRLDVLPIRIPPLAERSEDIPALAQHFLERVAARHGIVAELSDEALDLLSRRSWPGNVRQLENMINRLAVMADGNFITEKDIEIQGMASSPHHFPDLNQSAPNGQFLLLNHPDGANKSIAELEAEILQTTLDQHEGKVLRAAKALNLAKSTFYRKIEEYGLST